MEPTDSLPRSRDALLRESKDHVAIETMALCRELRIRALVGGGPVLSAQGLISPGVAPSASLVIDPASIRHLYLALRARGWRDAPASRRFRVLPSARLSLVRDGVRAGLILYSVIPGFFADPEETFDLLWERHRVVPLRGSTVPVLGRVSSAILASHEGLDGRSSRARSNFDFYVKQFRIVLDDRERAALVELIRKVGGCAEMSALLEALGVEPCAFTLPSLAYVQWRLQVDEASDQVRRTLALLELAKHGRARLRASEPRRARSFRDLVVSLTSAPATLRAIVGARRRWRAGFD
jgi:hypothetical protein